MNESPEVLLIALNKIIHPQYIDDSKVSKELQACQKLIDAIMEFNETASKNPPCIQAALQWCNERSSFIMNFMHQNPPEPPRAYSDKIEIRNTASYQAGIYIKKLRSSEQKAYANDYWGWVCGRMGTIQPKAPLPYPKAQAIRVKLDGIAKSHGFIWR